MYPRFVENRVNEALSDTRIVLLCGPRQSGKTTLAQQIAGEKFPFFTLDDPLVLEAAKKDPVGFVRGIDRGVIDEVHRASNLILPLKLSVDTDQRAGRFLLTGSANLMSLPHLADSLAGRMAIIRLLPLSQAELRGGRSSFLDRVFSGKALKPANLVIGDELVSAVLTGGYPEVLTRSSWSRQQDWHLDYVEAIIQRDVSDVGRIEKLGVMPRLLRILAQYSGKLVNYSAIGSDLALNHVSTKKYVDIFESLYLVHTLQPWFTNNLQRLIKTPKLHFLDSGLLAALTGVSSDRLVGERVLFGPLLESFVFGELLKNASWSNERYVFSHFRDKERNEVDIVIENRRGRIVGIEVKASATVTKKDFSGLRKLITASGDRFELGLVLYDGEQLVPFGDRMVAAPVSVLWS
ncbi:MAG: ATP-binding protein [Acidiferrobacterales bacterium]|nr:ATP-binding protein [Acidiferrobacterales bacterium]